MLNNIEFEWSIYTNGSWDVRYEELVIYVKQFGNARVPASFAENPVLGKWVMNQRTNYKNFLNGTVSCGLTDDKIQLLNVIGFEWNIHTSSWDERYKEFASYAKKFGDTHVPHQFAENPSLGKWVTTQRIIIKVFRIVMHHAVK